MKHNDIIQSFLFQNANIRGQIARLHDSYQTIIKQRAYPHFVKKMLAESLISTALLAGNLKFEGELSLQFQGDSRLPLLVVQCTDKLELRACANFGENLGEPAYADAFLAGKLSVSVRQINQEQPYQSLVPIQSLSMSENLSHYFIQSEQVLTKVWIASSEELVAGILLQALPGENTTLREEFWQYAITLGDTVSDEELLSLDNRTLLTRLYHESDCTLFHARELCFKCRCSAEKIQQALIILGKKEVDELIKEQGKVEVHCDFCNQYYHFDAVDAALIFHRQGFPIDETLEIVKLIEK